MASVDCLLIRAALCLRSESGILVLQILAGRLSHRGRIEAVLDDFTYPSFTTQKARSYKNTWDQIGEVFVRELQHSQITLRLNENDQLDDEDIVSEVTVKTRDLLAKAMVSARLMDMLFFFG